MSSNSTVEYKPIPNFPGYRVGSDGTVWSCWERFAIRGRRPRPGESCWRIGETWRELRQNFKPKKNRFVVEIAGETRFVHVLVLESFVGSRPDGMEACHNDGDSTNNQLSNLRWDTKKENARDRDRHGTTARGERVACAKLTADIVRQIRHDYSTGNWTQRQLAKKHGIRQSSLNSVLVGKSWRHVTDGPETDRELAEAPRELA